MNKKFKIGDIVVCIKETSNHRYSNCWSRYKRDRKEIGKKLTVAYTVNRFGKQYLFFEEYKPIKIETYFTNGTCKSTSSIFPLEASRFKLVNPFRQEEMEI